MSTSGKMVGPRSSYAIQTRPQGASRGDVTCTFAGEPTQQPRPSRGENRTALGQFRSQRHRRCNRARRFSKPLPNRRAVEGPETDPVFRHNITSLLPDAEGTNPQFLILTGAPDTIDTVSGLHALLMTDAMGRTVYYISTIVT